jgi:hypothetical protein
LSFASLVTWIAEHIKQILHLRIYINNNCSFDRAEHVLYYHPYRCYFPANQSRLLMPWDELGIPHEQRKQVYCPTVTFIGFDVDLNVMTISLNVEHRSKLFGKIHEFAKPGKRHTLKKFQSLGGHVNWSLAVFPLLKPALFALYVKTAGKTEDKLPIQVNNTICFELEWFIRHASAADGIFLLKAVVWDPSSDLSNATVCYADASMRGMAFWYPELRLGYQCCVPPSLSAPIFYQEAVAVTCTMICPTTPQSSCLVVCMDNHNTVDIWHSLKASAPYNNTLIVALDWVIPNKIDSWVLHVPGINNTVADTFSHFNNSLALCLVPGFRLGLFETP